MKAKTWKEDDWTTSELLGFNVIDPVGLIVAETEAIVVAKGIEADIRAIVDA